MLYNVSPSTVFQCAFLNPSTVTGNLLHTTALAFIVRYAVSCILYKDILTVHDKLRISKFKGMCMFSFVLFKPLQF